MQLVEEDEEVFRLRFQARLRATRKAMKLTQKEMAARLGVTEAIYPKLEKRDAFPLYLLPRLIQLTEKPYAYWCLGVDYGPAPTNRTARPLKSVK